MNSLPPSVFLKDAMKLSLKACQKRSVHQSHSFFSGNVATAITAAHTACFHVSCGQNEIMYNAARNRKIINPFEWLHPDPDTVLQNHTGQDGPPRNQETLP